MTNKAKVPVGAQSKSINIPINDIIPWDKNPRTITKSEFGRLKNQILKLGQYKPIVCYFDKQVGKYVALGGNMRLRALMELGQKEAWVALVNPKNEKEKLEYNISDNEKFGAYHDEQLAELILETPDLEKELYKVDLNRSTDLQSLLNEFGPSTAKERQYEDHVPASTTKEKKPISRIGDVFQIGQHRILCGDATKKETYDILMLGKKADACFTDPPYNIDYKGGPGHDNKYLRKKILNDSMTTSDFHKFLLSACQNIIKHTNGGIYICIAIANIETFKKAFVDSGGHWHQYIIWIKNHAALSRTDYQLLHEPILYGWNKEIKNHYFIDNRDIPNVWEDLKTVDTEFDGYYTTIKFHGFQVKVKGKVEGEVIRQKQRTDIWRYDKPVTSALHPTMKPVSLCREAITNSSPRGGIILDPFCGSGSTLIASEKTNRICHAIEMEPIYVDTTIERYLDFTKVSPDTVIRQSDGKTWNQLKKAERE